MDAFIDLHGRNILVSGASSGIGRQTAVTLSRLGADVILLGRNKEKLEQTRSEMNPGRHCVIPQDITEFDRMESTIESAIEKQGKISGFVHSAGLEMTLPLRNMTPALYERIFKTNVVAGFEIARILSQKKNIDEKGASFIFIASVMAIAGEAGKIAYASSKGALVSGVRAMALELVSRKVRVNAVSPGVVRTEMMGQIFDKLTDDGRKTVMGMHPMGLGIPEDIADVCAFLLSHRSRWITGTNLVIDGGYSAR